MLLFSPAQTITENVLCTASIFRIAIPYFRLLPSRYSYFVYGSRWIS